MDHMERHGKEAGLTQGPHGAQEHLLTPSGIAAEQRLVRQTLTGLSGPWPCKFLLTLFYLRSLILLLVTRVQLAVASVGAVAINLMMC